MFMRFSSSILNTFSSILFSRKARKGVAALITVLSLGGLVMTISMGMTIISFWANQNIKSIRDSNKAFYAAQSGLQDTLIKLERNKGYNSNFNLSINGTNDVSVTMSNSSGLAIATSTATLFSVNKKLQSNFVIDATTGLITPTSTIELTL